MKKTALVVVIIAAIAMMIGAQSALAAKPTSPVIGIANGKVTAFGINDALFVGSPGAPPPDNNASGPWKVVVHDPTGTMIGNFGATCQVAGVVYKLSYNGPGTVVLGPVTTITIPSIEVKSAGVSKVYTGDLGTTIVINPGANLATVDITSNGLRNMSGNVRLAKLVP